MENNSHNYDELEPSRLSPDIDEVNAWTNFTVEAEKAKAEYGGPDELNNLAAATNLRDGLSPPTTGTVPTHASVEMVDK